MFNKLSKLLLGNGLLKTTATQPSLSTSVSSNWVKNNAPDINEHKSLKQAWTSKLSKSEVNKQLLKLDPKIPWCHFYVLADDLYTVSPEQPKYFGKAKGLKIMAEQLVDSLPYILKKTDLKEISVLDLACAEGAHAIELAHAGLKKVVGIDGRQIYVDRANFVAECGGLSNTEFFKGDVRHINSLNIGIFDLVLFYGILHHLSEDDFAPMIKSLFDVTGDTLLLYTHTSEDGWEIKFKLGEEIINRDGYRGRLYREHPDGATDQIKSSRIRNSIDNTFSFWAREESLLSAIKDAGFKFVSKIMHPNPYDNPTGEFRVFYVCRK